MNGKRILIFAAFLSALFSCREPEPDIAPNTLSVTNYSDAAVESIRVTADGNVLLDSSSVNIHGDFLRLPFRKGGSIIRIEMQLSGSVNYYIDRTFVYNGGRLDLILNSDYTLTADGVKEIGSLSSGTKIRLSADQKRKQEEIEAAFTAYKNWQNDRTEKMVSVLSAMAKEGKVKLTLDNKELTEFETIQDIIDFFGLNPQNGYLGTVFEEISTVWQGTYETDEFLPKLSEIDAETDPLLPKAPQNLLLPALRGIASEDERYITPAEAAPIDKLSEGFRGEIYWYSGILEEAAGVKGAVPDGTVLWPKDRKNGNKHTIRFKFADEKANGGKGIPDSMKEVIKAGLKEIELATNGTLSHREITEAAEIFCSLSYVVVYYRESDEDWRGRAHVGRILGRGIYEINAAKITSGNNGDFLTPSSSKYPSLKLYRTAGQRVEGDLFETMRTIIHEWGHTSGLMHEHSRYDRNLYIDVEKSFSTGYQNDHNFSVCDSYIMTPVYDVFSIMNYSISIPQIGEAYRNLNQLYRPRTLSETDKSFLASIYGGQYKSPLSKLRSATVVVSGIGTTDVTDRIEWRSEDLGIRTNGNTNGYIENIFSYGIDLDATEQIKFCDLTMPDYFSDKVRTAVFYPGLFDGQSYRLKINGEIGSVNSGIIPLENPLTEIECYVTSQDQSHSTQYNFTIKKTDNTPRAISVRDRKSHSVIAEKTDFYYSDLNPGLIYTDWVRINVDGKIGQRIFIKKTSETVWKESNFYDVQLTGGKPEEIEVRIESFGPGSKIYRIPLMCPAEAATPELLNVSYVSGQDGDLNAGIETKTADLLNSDKVEFFMAEADDCYLRFQCAPKGDMPGQFVSFEAVSDKKTFSQVIEDGEIDYFLPANERTVVRISVKCGSLINIYEYVFLRYTFHRLTVTAEEGCRLRITYYPDNSDDNSPETVTREIDSNQTNYVTAKSIGLPKIQYQVAVGYGLMLDGSFETGSAGTYLKLSSKNPEQKIRGIVTSSCTQSVVLHKKNLNKTKLIFETTTAVQEGSLYLKSAESVCQYRIYKEENAGGAIAVFDVIKNGTIMEKEKLGWATYGNGWYPSENGWYTVKLKDRDNLFAVIRQDVDKGNYYANIYFEVDYEMPDKWQ